MEIKLALTLVMTITGLNVGSAQAEDRTIDGSGNNIANPDWGSAGTHLLRLTLASYDDLTSVPAGGDRPSARAVSNGVCEQITSVPNGAGVTDFVWQWGQFLDHDIDLTGSAVPTEDFSIPVPIGDPFFDPRSTGTEVIPLVRSLFDPATGTDSTECGRPRPGSLPRWRRPRQ